MNRSWICGESAVAYLHHLQLWAGLPSLTPPHDTLHPLHITDQTKPLSLHNCLILRWNEYEAPVKGRTAARAS